MNERRKILLAIVSFLAIVGLVLILFLPSRTSPRNLDFYIQDANGNSQLEVNEMIKFIVNDSVELAGRTVIWKMGNGDSLVGHPNLQYRYREAGK